MAAGTIIWLVLYVDDPPDGDKADVADIGGGGNDDGDGVDKRQEELPPTTEVVIYHTINKGKNRNKHSHGGEDQANCETAKYLMAVLEQPPSVQDVAYEVERGEYEVCDKS